MTCIAILDDEERMAEILAMVLRRDGHQVRTFHHPQALLDALANERFDLLLSDLKMPDIDGLEVLRRAKAQHAEMPVVLLTAHGTVDTAVAAMKEGAYDYLQKPIDNEACRAVVARALEHTRLSRENRYLRRQVQQRYGVGDVIAESAAMKRVLDLVERAARSSATVVVSGESGTGKEVIARAIHVESDRVAEPFVAVNCKAFAAGVLESELFGHVKGAFTGAEGGRAGVFERADHGTLFLDEIGEVGDDFQAKLLRVVQEREVQRVGDHRPRSVDVRIVSATNRDLQEEIAAGRFREDLYFRLAVVPIQIPRCASARRTCCRWRAASSPACAASTAAASESGATRSRGGCSHTTGRATSESSRTPSSAASFSAVAIASSSGTWSSTGRRRRSRAPFRSKNISIERPRRASRPRWPRLVASAWRRPPRSAWNARRSTG